jgi:hypothetical protein
VAVFAKSVLKVVRVVTSAQVACEIGAFRLPASRAPLCGAILRGGLTETRALRGESFFV